MIRISILGNILEFYYKIEDKWFDLLDWLDARHVPVYKVVDPIERAGIPSLPVFVALGLIILYLLFGFLGGAPIAPEYRVSLQIIDEDTNACYAYALINIKNSTGFDIYNMQTNEICPFETTLRGGLYSFDIMPENCNIYNKNISITGDMLQPMPISIPCRLHLRDQKTLCFSPGVGLGTVYVITRTGLTNVSDPTVCGEDSCTLEIQSGYYYRFDTDSNYYSGSLFLSYDYLDGLDPNAGECVPLEEKPSPTPKGEVDILLKSEDGSSVPNIRVEIIRPNSTSIIDYETTGPTGLAHFEEDIGTQFRIRVPAIGNTTWFLSTEVYNFTEEPQFINVTLSFTIPTKIKVYEIISNLKVYILGVFVVALDDQDVEQVNGFTDTDGLVEFGLESGEIYRLTFSKQGYEYIETNVTGGQTIEVEIERISEALTGRIDVKVLYEETYIPVDGATLTLYQKVDETWKKTGYGDASGWPTTASDGTASFTYVLPGTYCVTASKDEETLCDYDNPIELGPQDIIPVTIYMTPSKHNLYVKVIKADEVTPAEDAVISLYDTVSNPHRTKPSLDTKTTNRIGEIDPPFSVENERDIYLYVEYQDPEGTWFTYRTSSIIMDKQKTETITLIPLDETMVNHVETLDEAQETYDSTILNSNKTYYFVFSLGVPNTTAGEAWDEISLYVDDKGSYLEFQDAWDANGAHWWLETSGDPTSQTIKLISGYPDPGVPRSLKVPVKVKDNFEGTKDYFIKYWAVWEKGGIEVKDPSDIPYKRVNFTLYSGKDAPPSKYPLHITVLKPDETRAGGATVTIYDVELESVVENPKNTHSTKGTVDFTIDAGKEIYAHIDYQDPQTYEVYSQDYSPFSINEETWVNYTLISINNDVKFVKILNDYNDPSSEADLSELNDDGTYYLVFSLGIENISGQYPTSAELTVVDINSEDIVDFIDGCNVNTNPDLSCPEGKSTTSSASGFDDDESFTINVINKEWRPEIIIPIKVKDVESMVDNYYLRYEASWTGVADVRDPANPSIWHTIYFNITTTDKPDDDVGGKVMSYYIRKNGGEKIFIDDNGYPIVDPGFEIGDQISIGFNLTWQNRVENFDKIIELVENGGLATSVTLATSIKQLDYIDEDTTQVINLNSNLYRTMEPQKMTLFKYFKPEGLEENDSLIVEVAFKAEIQGNDLFALFISNELDQYYSISIAAAKAKEIGLFSINDDMGVFDLSEMIKVEALEKVTFIPITEKLSKLVISGDSLASPRCQWPKDDEGGIDLAFPTNRKDFNNGDYTFELNKNELPVCQLSSGNLKVTHDDPASVYQAHSDEVTVESCIKTPGWDDIQNSIMVEPQEPCDIYFAFVDGEDWDYNVDNDCRDDGEATVVLGVLNNGVCNVTGKTDPFKSISGQDLGIESGCTENIDCTLDYYPKVDHISPEIAAYSHKAGKLEFEYTERIEIGIGGAQVIVPNPWIWVNVTALSENKKVDKEYWIPIKLQVRYKEIAGAEEREYFTPMNLQSYAQSYYNCRRNWCTVEQLMKYLSDREVEAGLVSCDSYFPGSTSYTGLKLVDSTIDSNILQGTMGIVGNSSVTYRVSSDVPDSTKTYLVIDEDYLPLSGTNRVRVERIKDSDTGKCSSFLSFTKTSNLPTDVSAFQLYLPVGIYDKHGYYNTRMTAGHVQGIENAKELMEEQWGLRDFSPPEEYAGSVGENWLIPVQCPEGTTSPDCDKLGAFDSAIYREGEKVYFAGKDAADLLEIIQQMINLVKGEGANLIINRDLDIITIGPSTFGINVSDHPTFKLEDHDDLIEDIEYIINDMYGVRDPVLLPASFDDSTILLSLCADKSNCQVEYEDAFEQMWGDDMEIPDTGIAWKGLDNKFYIFSNGDIQNLKCLADTLGNQNNPAC